MLQIARSMKELNFGKLMAVYAEGNAENAREQYANLPFAQGVAEAEQDFYHYLSHVFFRTENAFYAIWVDAERYVSALRIEPYRDGWLLEAVETAPDMRCKGYAAALLEVVMDALGQGRLYSHIHKANVPSQRLHARGGFCKISDHAVYIDGSVNDRCCTYLRILERKGE